MCLTLPTVTGRVDPTAAARDGAPVTGAVGYPRALVVLVCTAAAAVGAAGIHAAAWLVGPSPPPWRSSW
ncbi:hypothetical protein [Pseudonocardia humida]|uniref:Ig-like domain-containing protein n=1 Tax=Pseudonocardia humida TaxID=2800819 RepID=A0ABT1ADF2_9PSEU|nr:hypothetical protein [Pseudonocardia humida]MCO1661104.1 hypothetical protein [Pseudonocardia humida]